MNQIMQFNLTDIMPTKEAVLQSQGISEGVTVKPRIQALIAEAMDIFAKSAQPVGTIKELFRNDFETVLRGEGQNAEDTPIAHIFPQADHLALFALTMGSDVSLKIEELFKNNDFALGSMLDSVASLAADKAVEVCETTFSENLRERHPDSSDNHVLSYSPGYCGWHISGQKRLFQFLQPERIGISLNNSFLMIPLKSVTGVLIAGKKEIHFFETDFPFCSDCKTHSCRLRMISLVLA